MNTFIQMPNFEKWLSELVDQKAQARILARIRSATLGNFVDSEPVGEGISELRIHFGAGGLKDGK